ncbi:MAG: L,D-transpeptidase [Bacteroidales bacterium]
MNGTQIRVDGLQRILVDFKDQYLLRFVRMLTSGSFRVLKQATRIILWISGIFALMAFILYLFLWFVPAVSELVVPGISYPGSAFGDTGHPGQDRIISAAEKELQALERKYDALTPRQHYLVINTSENHFYLYHNKAIIREGFVSTGSNIRMVTNDNREWVFKTPKGKHTVKNKITLPVWKKPDWAFIEDGLPVPPRNHSSRFEYGSLGDSALNLGYGYLIHGTLYKRFLGMPVTHGCIRLNDEDLEYIYKTLHPGSKVYIF